MRSRLLAVGATLACVALAVWAIAQARHAALFLGDFRAFVCGGRALFMHADPYGQRATYACETTPQGWGVFRARNGIALPAPFPAYALAEFVPFGLLPFAVSALVWLAASAAAVVLVTRLVAQRFDVAPVPTFVALWVPFALIVFPYGEHAALALGALALIAHGVRRNRVGAVAIGLAAFALLPHVFIPLAVALAVCLPQQRRTVALTVAVLALADVALRGPFDALRYLTTVLPAHALAEIDGTNQYGVAWILHGIGLDARSSLAFSRVVYGVGVALAVGAASRVRRATHCDEAIVFVPVVFAVAFSPFVHYAEIALALPAAILLARAARGRYAVIATSCFAALALPWEMIVAHPALTSVFAATAACCVLTVRGRAPEALRFALGASLVSAVLILFAHGGPALRHASVSSQHSELAQASWSRYVAEHRSSDAPVWWALKAPTWMALLGLALCGARLRANEQHKTPVFVRNAPLRLKGQSFG